MDSADEAIAAIDALKGLEVNGRMLDVKIASPKGSRPEPKENHLQNKKFNKPFNPNSRPSGGGGGQRSGGGGRSGRLPFRREYIKWFWRISFI